eukprot:GHVU01191749.1.p2 GENE.GHVU01191749.1~~GHVU01191749.1.p2  ORF type:complete len:403 (+),score=75.48 GHVU01191749.1:602-1810(+)
MYALQTGADARRNGGGEGLEPAGPSNAVGVPGGALPGSLPGMSAGEADNLLRVVFSADLAVRVSEALRNSQHRPYPVTAEGEGGGDVHSSIMPYAGELYHPSPPSVHHQLVRNDQRVRVAPRCPMCWIREDENLMALPCGHVFHRHCVDSLPYGVNGYRCCPVTACQISFADTAAVGLVFETEAAPEKRSAPVLVEEEWKGGYPDNAADRWNPLMPQNSLTAGRMTSASSVVDHPRGRAGRGEEAALALPVGCYRGHQDGGVPNGSGVQRRDDGTQWYEGDWFRGRKHGFGVQKRNDGTVWYEGQWQAGKHHGFGIERRKDGTVYYEGEYRDGRMHGCGVHRYRGGDAYYEGDWRDDQKHGYGILWNLKKQVDFAGLWKKGLRLHSSGSSAPHGSGATRARH